MAQATHLVWTTGGLLVPDRSTLCFCNAGAHRHQRPAPHDLRRLPMETLDFAIIGAGMAGASVAWQLAGQASVLLLERESQPGYHTTGRSAALFLETYGTPQIRAPDPRQPGLPRSAPTGFCRQPPPLPRGVLYIAGPDQMDLLDATWQELHTHSPSLQRLGPAELVERAPCLRLEALGGGLAESGAADIDVHGLHQGYLRGLRQRGGAVRTHAEVTGLSRADGLWTVQLQDGSRVQARTVVNAAGAWADVVGQMAGPRPSASRPAAARLHLSRHPTAWTCPACPPSLPWTKASTSSPTRASCWARPPTPTPPTRTTWCPRRSTWPPASSISSR